MDPIISSRKKQCRKNIDELQRVLCNIAICHGRKLWNEKKPTPPQQRRTPRITSTCIINNIRVYHSHIEDTAVFFLRIWVNRRSVDNQLIHRHARAVTLCAMVWPLLILVDAAFGVYCHTAPSLIVNVRIPRSELEWPNTLQHLRYCDGLQLHITYFKN